MLKGSSKLIPNKSGGLAKVPWNWFQAVCLSILMWLGASLGIVGLFALADKILGLNLGGHDSVTLNFLFQALSGLALLGLLWAIVSKRFKSGFSQLGLRKFNFLQALALILLASVTLVVLSVIAYMLAEKLFPGINLDQEQLTGFDGAHGGAEMALAFIGLVIIAPATEELIFRGFMLPAFSQRFGFVAGSIVTASLFGLAHWQVNVSIITFIMGLLLALLYKKTGSVWPAILFHSLKNLVAFVIIF